ncbi:hypothetical protein GCM10027075_25970 [Streptomyces heilongjiangensis]
MKVYSSGNLGGRMTICLTPGQEVGHNGAADDNGDPPHVGHRLLTPLTGRAPRAGDRPRST